MQSFIICVLFLPLCSALFGLGRRQSVAVQGSLVCDGIPSANVKVVLVEKEIFNDRNLDEGKTNTTGGFRLFGSAVEISDIDPVLTISHKCSYIGLCSRQFLISIPDKYIATGNSPRETYDIGKIELKNKQVGEELECVN